MLMDFIKLDNTTDHKELLKMLNGWIEDSAKKYRVIHDEWEKNILFYLGKHWIEKRANLDGYIIYEDDDHHFYPVTNYAKLFTNYKLNQIVSKQVEAVVRPASLEPNDIFTARLAHLALKARHQIDEEDDIDRVVFLHALICNQGWRTTFKEKIPNKFLKKEITQKVDTSYYQCPVCSYRTTEKEPVCPQCGAEMKFNHQVEDQAMIDPETNMPAYEQIPLYQVCSSVVDPFRIMISRAFTRKDRKWIIDQSMQSVRWIKDNFSEEDANGYTGLGGSVKESSHVPRALKVSEGLQDAIANKHSAVFNTVSSSDSQYKNEEESTLFCKIYLDKSANFPNGRLIIITADQVLYDGKPDVPQRKRKYGWWHPYTDYIWEYHPMNSGGTSFIGDLIPLNKQINAMDAMMMEYLDKIATPTRVEFDNVQQNQEDNTDGVIKIKGMIGLPQGGAPFYLTSPSLPSSIVELREKKVAEMEKMAKTPEVSQGLNPTGVETFRGLKLLRAAIESAEADPSTRVHKYVKSYSKLKLCLMQECMIVQDSEMSDMMKTLNANEGFNVEQLESFVAADLSDQWNIDIEETDYLSNTKGAEQEKVHDAIESQIISVEELQDPLMKYNILQRLGLADIVDTFGSEDIKKSMWIIQLLESQKFDKLQGVIQNFDNKPLHLRVLTAWMKKPKFYSLDIKIQQMAQALVMELEQAVALAVQPPPASPSDTTVPQGEIK